MISIISRLADAAKHLKQPNLFMTERHSFDEKSGLLYRRGMASRGVAKRKVGYADSREMGVYGQAGGNNPVLVNFQLDA